jgi:hypothetical protein
MQKSDLFHIRFEIKLIHKHLGSSHCDGSARFPFDRFRIDKPTTNLVVRLLSNGKLCPHSTGYHSQTGSPCLSTPNDIPAPITIISLHSPAITRPATNHTFSPQSAIVIRIGIHRISAPSDLSLNALVSPRLSSDDTMDRPYTQFTFHFQTPSAAEAPKPTFARKVVRFNRKWLLPFVHLCLTWFRTLNRARKMAAAVVHYWFVGLLQSWITQCKTNPTRLLAHSPLSLSVSLHTSTPFQSFLLLRSLNTIFSCLPTLLLGSKIIRKRTCVSLTNRNAPDDLNESPLLVIAFGLIRVFSF